VVSKWTGVPMASINQDEGDKLLRMEGDLHKRVISQEKAISAISRAIRRSRAGLKNPARPVGSFVFLGPTGVGKTELARALANFLFGSDHALIRFDMSEYMEKHSVSKLIGAPPGYVGYEEGGQLTERVRRTPYSVILLDEVEKAHPDVYNILLQVFEDGQLTDGLGNTVDFRNTIVLLTSNVGAETIKKQSSIGFTPITDEHSYDKMREKIMDEAKRAFRPEFLNRLDDIIVFRSLTKPDLIQILDLEISKVMQRLKARNIQLQFDESAKDFLVEKGYDPTYGARPMRRAVERYLEDPLAEEILKGQLHDNEPIQVSVANDKLSFEQRAAAQGALSS
jgi:ATP-dependent Clp protease ATP-binding subunit ClpC